MESKIKAIRTDIDALSQCIDKLGITKQLLSAKDELLFAKAWMGKMLGAMGVDTPYKNEGKRNLVEDIEPTAEHFEGDIILPEDLSTIGAIDWIRQQIATKVSDIEMIGTEKGGRKAGVLKEQVYVHLCEARFWLGFELERIRLVDEDLSKSNGQE